MIKDDLRVIRSTSKTFERCQLMMMRNFLFPREDSRIIEYRKKYNLIEFV